jgi:hypothetical protein
MRAYLLVFIGGGLVPPSVNGVNLAFARWFGT